HGQGAQEQAPRSLRKPPDRQYHGEHAVMGAALPNFDVQTLLDQDLQALDAAKHRWAKTSVADRVAILGRIKPALMQVAQGWAETAARKKRIPHASPLAGEEWISGPYALMAACNGLMHTLAAIDRKEFLAHLHLRRLKNGQLSVGVVPHSIWDRDRKIVVEVEEWNGCGCEGVDGRVVADYD